MEDNTNNDSGMNFLLGCLALGGFVWAINEKNKVSQLTSALQKSQTSYLKLLNDYTKHQSSFTEEIKRQLVELRKNYEGINDAVAIELKSITELIEGGQEETAIAKLTKVIENLLKDKYIAEGKASDTKSCPQLFKMLQGALNFNWIDQNEYNFSNLLREQRNQEAHELAVKFPENWRYISFLSGIEIIYKLKGFRNN
ncbi:hypothetical protein DI487_00795 [Flavobacterium sediminis]|uniref:DUF4145 domain-containing protein n=1 Tax=Flavobacterium sediminis TaxID=2201181 RepID=A0A2U8QR50_9FLAO|nr:hypothetical protein [Flavobacterium sediminis]AWM12551.1 hypothetical protein DI487_00795 [Flavobacterium sediminis]